MIRERLPDATIITFWHIPWPNPEAFAICPWREELLDGLLGSSILGFHTQFHCNNFLDTVDRAARGARRPRDVRRRRTAASATRVQRYPDLGRRGRPPRREARPRGDDRARRSASGSVCRADQAIGIGVDRMDYTKGHRGAASAPSSGSWSSSRNGSGEFTFVQIAAPTREQHRAVPRPTRIGCTRSPSASTQRFPDRRAPAILLRAEHHDAHEVFEFYRAADLCFVSSLHDGMNLVAKEFVASRDDEAGVLLLSQFTGAARELPEALVVNPYDADQCATALDAALTMPLRSSARGCG